MENKQELGKSLMKSTDLNSFNILFGRSEDESEDMSKVEK